MKIIEQKEDKLIVELDIDPRDDYEPVLRIAKEFFDDDIEYTLNKIFDKGCDYYIESL